VSRDCPVVLGAVAYDAKVVNIWEGFRAWFHQNGLATDFILFSNYERQVEALIGGRIDVAWNSPLAWVRSSRLARALGFEVKPIVMRDTDRDLASVIIARADGLLRSVDDLRGCTIATGAIDSPQATILPVQLLKSAGLIPDLDVYLRRSSIGIGLHGDHIGGEREAARALVGGSVEAACIADGNHLLFAQEGTLPAGSTRVIAETPLYDHCMLTSGPAADWSSIERLSDLMLGMEYSDPAVRPLFDLEGLTAWVPGRTSGFGQLEAAVDSELFYDEKGTITAVDYRP